MLGAALIGARPLQERVWGATAAAQTATQLPFQRITSAAQLERALQQADGRVRMVDLYADWCVACKEFEKYTLGHLQVLQANVNANNTADNALLQRLQVLGLLTILFF